MKTKKKAKKNRTTRNNSAYTPGRNVFGEKAETHLIVLKRETAFQQMMDAICQLMAARRNSSSICAASTVMRKSSINLWPKFRLSWR